MWSLRKLFGKNRNRSTSTRVQPRQIQVPKATMEQTAIDSLRKKGINSPSQTQIINEMGLQIQERRKRLEEYINKK